MHDSNGEDISIPNEQKTTRGAENHGGDHQYYVWRVDKAKYK
ncbi:hypothetical protein [Mesorhizobium sp. LNHC252B00]|nr:hypothetical protein [Mesorhizobium sp. LNHC252B00]